ncbi:RyR domain-containing protein [Sandaracinobacter neustonicus]|uniref:RyR domain-containing protein n=1 Tax=Sandaracinobacter neustonicus TaxID=1715348 RepID=UPI0015E406D1|nr:RyR domain-containing protein [Sandaracinobacter neustonicus]
MIGDHPLIDGVVAAAASRRTRVTWITGSPDAAPDAAAEGALLVAGPLDPDHARQHGNSAARAIIAFADEARQVSAIEALRAEAPGLPITVNYTDGLFTARPTGPGVRIVSQVQLAVRDLHWRNPPALIAQQLGQPRIHALLFGFGRGGNIILTDLLLCSLTGFQGKPLITIVDPRAAEREAALFRRCPELRESADIRFVDPGPVEDARHLPADLLRRAQAEAPFTTAHVSIDSDARSLSLARALHALALREKWRMGPVFTRLSNSRDLARLPVSHEAAELVGFGANADFAESIGLFDPNSDYLARLFHQAYRRTARADAPANRPWEDLPEEYRESNRRLLIHLPAKLLTAGVDLAAWLRVPLPRPNDMGGIPLPDLSADPALMEELAELEHRRWMVDRRLSGWRYGPVRDNEARLHPDLIPYDQLDEYTKDLDRAIVREAWETLGSSRGSGFFARGSMVRQAG